MSLGGGRGRIARSKLVRHCASEKLERSCVYPTPSRKKKKQWQKKEKNRGSLGDRGGGEGRLLQIKYKYLLAAQGTTPIKKPGCGRRGGGITGYSGKKGVTIKKTNELGKRQGEGKVISVEKPPKGLKDCGGRKHLGGQEGGVWLFGPRKQGASTYRERGKWGGWPLLGAAGSVNERLSEIKKKDGGLKTNGKNGKSSIQKQKTGREVGNGSEKKKTAKKGLIEAQTGPIIGR